MLQELEALRAEVAELYERVDFTERLLANPERRKRNEPSSTIAGRSQRWSSHRMSQQAELRRKPAADTTTGVRLANPPPRTALIRGTLSIEQDPSGGQFGVCSFPENHQCEEWAMLRGHCPVGGIKVTAT